MAEEEKVEEGTKKEKKHRVRAFFSDFTTFIKRGNILDMAVGVIIGGAFTAIVNALSNQILKPIINWVLAMILGADSLDKVYTFLSTAYLEDGTIDLTNSIYIDWGAFINAIINFLLIALVLFIIIKVMISLSKMREKAKQEMEEAIEKRIAEREAKKAEEEAAKKASEAEEAEQADAKAEEAGDEPKKE